MLPWEPGKFNSIQRAYGRPNESDDGDSICARRRPARSEATGELQCKHYTTDACLVGSLTYKVRVLSNGDLGMNIAEG